MSRTIGDGRTIASVLGAAVLVTVALGALTTNETTTGVVDDPNGPVMLENPSDLTVAEVAGTSSSTSASFLGIHFGSSTSRVTVLAPAPPGCADAVTTGAAWPADAAVCASPLPITGLVTGLGIAPTGESLVWIDVEVSRACYEAVRHGDAWPHPAAACRQG